MRRFRQAISEGDGISAIPILDGDVATLAEAAEAAGAEAVAVTTLAHVEQVRAVAALPVIWRERRSDSSALADAHAAGADACVLVLEDLRDEDELLEELHAQALELGFDCALEVDDESELADALERVDPYIVLIREGEPSRDEGELERTLDLLPDVPVGKLVITEGRVDAREQVVALERAGVDAIVVENLVERPDFAEAVETLVGRPLA